MNRIRSLTRTPFGSALAGGLIVAVLGWVAIVAGLLKSESTTTTAQAPLAPATLAAPASQQSAGKGLTVNQIYAKDSPGVAFVQAQQAPKPASPLNPFGGGGGGTATGSGFVIDTAG